jgi:cell division protein FtsZ
MDRGGGALVSIGYGEGSDRVMEAAQVALKSPLLDIESIEGTDGLLVNITGGEDLTLAEVDRAMKLISKAAVPGAKILFGAVVDPQMEGRVQITLIATGLGVEKTITAPAKQEGVSLAEIFGDDLAVPAFMRSPAYAQAGWRN